jgi:YVTN family beta-propeller protein
VVGALLIVSLAAGLGECFRLLDKHSDDLENVHLLAERFMHLCFCSWNRDMHTHRPATWCCCLLLSVLSCSTATAEIVATGFFSGTIERFDPVSGQQSTFADLRSQSDPFPGLAGIAFDQSSNLLYASARISNRIYRIDATSGTVLGFTQLGTGSSPAGLTVDATGHLYVANNGNNTVSVLDSGGNVVSTINLPDVGVGDNFPSGLAFDSQGGLVISTFAGGGLFRFDPTDDSVVPFAAGPTANGQVAVDATGDLYVGGAAFSNEVLKFNPDGTPVDAPFLSIGESLLPQPSEAYLSPDFTSPSGVAIDEDGNLIVAALGRTNPTEASDGFQSNGGLWKFSPDGELLQTFGTAGTLTPLSSVTTITVIPEPGAAALLAAVGMLLTLRRRRTPTDRRG